jgi:hypothetical protein
MIWSLSYSVQSRYCVLQPINYCQTVRCEILCTVAVGLAIPTSAILRSNPQIACKTTFPLASNVTICGVSASSSESNPSLKPLPLPHENKRPSSTHPPPQAHDSPSAAAQATRSSFGIGPYLTKPSNASRHLQYQQSWSRSTKQYASVTQSIHCHHGPKRHDLLDPTNTLLRVL